MAKAAQREHGGREADAFMRQLEHPFKAEVQAIRKLIKSANTDIDEQIKWNAPSFSYNGESLVTFNLRAIGHVDLVFHNPMISKVRSSLLEGDYDGRRMAFFASMNEVTRQKAELVRVLKDLIRLNEKESVTS